MAAAARAAAASGSGAARSHASRSRINSTQGTHGRAGDGYQSMGYATAQVGSSPADAAAALGGANRALGVRPAFSCLPCCSAPWPVSAEQSRPSGGVSVAHTRLGGPCLTLGWSCNCGFTPLACSWATRQQLCQTLEPTPAPAELLHSSLLLQPPLIPPRAPARHGGRASQAQGAQAARQEARGRSRRAAAGGGRGRPGRLAPHRGHCR